MGRARASRSASLAWRCTSEPHDEPSALRRVINDVVWRPALAGSGRFSRDQQNAGAATIQGISRHPIGKSTR